MSWYGNRLGHQRAAWKRHVRDRQVQAAEMRLLKTAVRIVPAVDMVDKIIVARKTMKDVGIITKDMISRI